MSRLYAADAVHEFPFTAPGVPSRIEGRDEIVNWIAAGGRANRLRYERYRTFAVHGTDDPETIIVVLTVRDGQIAHLRDYVNVSAAAAALRGERHGGAATGQRETSV